MHSSTEQASCDSMEANTGQSSSGVVSVSVSAGTVGVRPKVW